MKTPLLQSAKRPRRRLRQLFSLQALWFRVFIERPRPSGARLVRFAGCRPLMARLAFKATAEVSGEETLSGGVELQAVLGTGKAVALVLKEEVLVVYALLLHGGHDLLGL